LTYYGKNKPFSSFYKVFREKHEVLSQVLQSQ